MQNIWHSTTILCLKKGGDTVIASDGQVTQGPTVIKATANKLRTILDSSIVAGFAGTAADGLILFKMLEEKLERYSNTLKRAVVELAKSWCTDKYLRKLDAMLITADKDDIFILTGNGDVLQPDESVAAIGSGGTYARAAASAMMLYCPEMSAVEIAEKAMKIAADLCIYTNHNILIKKVNQDERAIKSYS